MVVIRRPPSWWQTSSLSRRAHTRWRARPFFDIGPRCASCHCRLELCRLASHVLPAIHRASAPLAKAQPPSSPSRTAPRAVASCTLRPCVIRVRALAPGLHVTRHGCTRRFGAEMELCHEASRPRLSLSRAAPSTKNATLAILHLRDRSARVGPGLARNMPSTWRWERRAWCSFANGPRTARHAGCTRVSPQAPSPPSAPLQER